MWIGNLDGRRQGLVIASTKARAIEIVGGSRKNFNDYWREKDVIVEPYTSVFEPEVLYTRPFAGNHHGTTVTWHRGRCPL